MYGHPEHFARTYSCFNKPPQEPWIALQTPNGETELRFQVCTLGPDSIGGSSSQIQHITILGTTTLT